MIGSRSVIAERSIGFAAFCAADFECSLGAFSGSFSFPLFASGLRAAGFFGAVGTTAGFVVEVAVRDLVVLVLDSADAGVPLVRAVALVVAIERGDGHVQNACVASLRLGATAKMPSRRDSPNRRRSIAVPDQNKPAFIARSKRRAHSIVAGDRLSPLARARRSLVRLYSFNHGSSLIQC